MADHPVQLVARAGTLILDLLKEAPSVRYSVFYGDTKGQEEWLVKEICETDEEVRRFEEETPSIVDSAVYQLEQLGIVETENLNNELIDGFHDYRISLTPTGKSHIERRSPIPYRDVYF